jgi:hypothetical protein
VEVLVEVAGGRQSARAPQVGLPMRRLVGSEGETGRKACRSRHSSAVKRQSLLCVAQNQQVFVLGVTDLRGSLRGALARGPEGIADALAAVVAAWAAKI